MILSELASYRNQVTELSAFPRMFYVHRPATVIQITDEVLLGCVQLLETNPLRSSNAIQIASALAWHSDMFVSADARQCAAAKASGLSVIKL
jgi:predicted nucleic acid-binding protein